MRITSQTIILALSLGLGACDSADPAGDESSTGAATSTTTADSSGTTGADSEPDHGCPACEDASTSTTGDESSSTGDDATTGEASNSSDVGSSSSTGEPASFCGDGQVDEDEDCDDGAENSDISADACRTDCTSPRCGDGVVDLYDYCDDGNAVGGDGCSASCQRWDWQGIAKDVPEGGLVNWTPCSTSTYGEVTEVSSILAACTGKQIAFACRLKGSANFAVLAHAPKSQIIAQEPIDGGNYVVLNGSYWDWSDTRIAVYSSLDGELCNGELCWPVSGGQLQGGVGRCGNAYIPLEAQEDWERVVLESHY